MARVLILLALIALVWWLLRPRPQRRGRSADASDAAAPAAEAREIVACAHCGVHVPRDEALPGPDGTPYCCEAHRRAGRLD